MVQSELGDAILGESLPGNEGQQADLAPGFDEPFDATGITVLEPAIPPATAIIQLGCTREQIAAKRAEFAGIEFTTKDGYEQGRLAIAYCRDTRVAIGERKKALKDPHYAYLDSVESEAKAFLALIEELEHPLKAKKLAEDNKRDEERKAEARRKQAEIEATLRAEREKEDAERKAKHEAEQAALAEERAKLEAEKAAAAADRADREAKAREAEEAALAAKREADAELAAQKKALADQEAQMKAQREAFEREQAEFQERQQVALRAEATRLAKIEEERLAAERAEQERVEAAAQAERERLAAEEQARQEVARAEAEATRLEAMRPDIEKVRAFAKHVRGVAAKLPAHLASVEASTIIAHAVERIDAIAAELEGFGSEVPAAAE